MGKVEINTEYGKMRFYIYKVEVGVLLDKDNDEYEDYNKVYDKLNAYYDENVGFEIDYNMALEFAKNYVDKGVNGTYAIISKIEFDSEYYKLDMQETMQLIHSIVGGGTIECYNDLFLSEDLYSTDNIVYSLLKQRDKDHPYYLGKGNGKIIEDFIQKCVVSNK